MPEKALHFASQAADEEVLLVLHRHWFNLLSHFFVLFLLLVFCIGSLFTIPLFFGSLLGPAQFRLFLFLENTFVLLLWVFGFLAWIDHYFDVWIVTDQRIVNIEQKGLFLRRTSELNLFRIQDVTSTINGVIPTVLNYGDVRIQTAGEEDHFIFRQIPDPLRVKDVIIKLSEETEKADLRSLAETLRTH